MTSVSIICSTYVSRVKRSSGFIEIKVQSLEPDFGGTILERILVHYTVSVSCVMVRKNLPCFVPLRLFSFFVVSARTIDKTAGVIMRA